MSEKKPASDPSTEGMVDYNAHSTAQQSMVAAHAHVIRKLVEDIGSTRPEFRVADYGCGPGISTIGVARPTIEAYRELDAEGPVAVCHIDQPGNDWNALFELLIGPDGYIEGRSGIRPEAAVGSFYDRVVSDASVNLATCFAASHWLSHAVRLDAPGTVWFADLQGEARREMERLARHDWLRFLRLRAEELRPGGYLLVSTLGSVPDSDEASGVAASGRGIYRAIQFAAQSMADEGLLDKTVLDHFVFGLWFQTEQEARGPIETDPVLKAAFEIRQISVPLAPANAGDVFGALIGDPKAYARQYTGYMKAFADSTLRRQLFEPGARNNHSSSSLAEEFYRRFEALYRESPGKYKFELWHLTVILRRR
jgi:SAM dependent carboxyl methyltransferase